MSLVTEKPVGEIESILAQYPGLLWHHCPDSRGCHGTPGMPDFIVIGQHGVSWREAKPDGDHPRGDQITWKYGLIVAGANWGVWTPGDVNGGLIHAQLETLR